MEWIRLQERKFKGHTLSGRVKLSSSPVLPFLSSVHTRASGMSSMALPARWADTSRSRVRLQKRIRLRSLPWTTPRIFHLCQERQRFFQDCSREKAGCIDLGQHKRLITSCSHPALPPHRQWWTSSADNVKANPEQLCWDGERGKS